MPPVELLDAKGEEEQRGKSSESGAGESTTPVMAVAARKNLAALRDEIELTEGLSRFGRGWLPYIA